MSSCSTAAMEVLLEIFPLDLYIESGSVTKEKRKGKNRLHGPTHSTQNISKFRKEDRKVSAEGTGVEVFGGTTKQRMKKLETHWSNI